MSKKKQTRIMICKRETCLGKPQCHLPHVFVKNVCRKHGCVPYKKTLECNELLKLQNRIAKFEKKSRKSSLKFKVG